MRIAFVVIGAAVLVAGASMIAFAPFYTNTGYYRAALHFTQVGGFNASSAASLFSSYADRGELIAFVGVVLAPIGAAILAYGLASGKNGVKEGQAAPPIEPVQA